MKMKACAAFLALAPLLTATPALGLANRVFVSARSGNDANACDDVVTPCQTLAGAVTQVVAGGAVIVLDSGGYGPVTITQSVTIEAAPGVTAFIHPPASGPPSTGDAITVNAFGAIGAVVVLRGLVLNAGFGHGIDVLWVGSLHIENCVISGFAGAAIVDAAFGSTLFVKDTIARQNGWGIILNEGVHASIDHCRIEGNTHDGVFMIKAVAAVRDSIVAGNGGNGFSCQGAGVLTVHRCLATGNSAGLEAISSTVRVAESAIVDNATYGLANFDSSTIESLGNNLVRGNTPDVSGTITTVPGI